MTTTDAFADARAASDAALSRLFSTLSGGGVGPLYSLATFGYVVTRVVRPEGVAYVLSDVDGPLVNVGAIVILSQGELVAVPGEVDEATRAAFLRFVNEAVRPQLT